MVAAFRALAHESRLRIFTHLVQARHDLSVGEIREAVGLPGPTLSHHLDRLRRAGLVAARREQRHVFHSVRRDTVMELVRLLTACC
jgi:DNA-binding transcriptional ArsR family regulator